MEILKSCPFEEPVGKYKIENDKPMMTKEEWFCQLPTKEKAKVFANATYSSACLATEILFFGKEAEQEKWEMWLKQPHGGDGE